MKFRRTHKHLILIISVFNFGVLFGQLGEINHVNFKPEKVLQEQYLASSSNENGNDAIHSMSDSFFYFTFNSSKTLCRINIHSGTKEYFAFSSPIATIQKIYASTNWLILAFEDGISIQYLNPQVDTFEEKGFLKINSEPDFIYIHNKSLYLVSIYPEPQTFVNSKSIFLTKINLTSLNTETVYSYKAELFEQYFIGSVKPFCFKDDYLYWIENNSGKLNQIHLLTGQQKVFELNIVDSYKSVFTRFNDSALLRIKSSRIFSQPVQSLQALNKEFKDGNLLFFDLFINDSNMQVVAMEASSFKYMLIELKLDTTASSFANIESVKKFTIGVNRKDKIKKKYIPPIYNRHHVLTILNKQLITVEFAKKSNKWHKITNRKLAKYREEDKLIKKPCLWIIKSTLY